MDVSRKQFVETLLAGSALLVIHGCGGGSDYNGSAGNPMPTSGCSDAISNNHGHLLSIPSTDSVHPATLASVERMIQNWTARRKSMPGKISWQDSKSKVQSPRFHFQTSDHGLI